MCAHVCVCLCVCVRVLVCVCACACVAASGAPGDLARTCAVAGRVSPPLKACIAPCVPSSCAGTAPPDIAYVSLTMLAPRSPAPCSSAALAMSEYLACVRANQHGATHRCVRSVLRMQKTRSDEPTGVRGTASICVGNHPARAWGLVFGHVQLAVQRAGHVGGPSHAAVALVHGVAEV